MRRASALSHQWTTRTSGPDEQTVAVAGRRRPVGSEVVATAAAVARVAGLDGSGGVVVGQAAVATATVATAVAIAAASASSVALEETTAMAGSPGSPASSAVAVKVAAWRR